MRTQSIPDRRTLLLAGVAAGFAAGTAGLTILAPSAARADSAGKIAADAHQALEKLYAKDATARALGARARAVLVFPEITKAGFIIGGEGGSGAMFSPGGVLGYYQISAGSIGLQAGVQKFGYALFFMTDKAIAYVRSSEGWSIGTGPSVVIVDKGFARSLNTTTLRKDVYAMAFDQKGLMAGLGLQGSKISRINPGPT